MKIITLLSILVLLTPALAQGSGGETWEMNPADDPSHFTMIISEEYSDASFTLECMDFRYAYENGTDIAAMTENYKTTLGTDVAQFCNIYNVVGNPYFFPTEIQYIAGTNSYSVGYDDYADIEGETGALVEGGVVSFAFAYAEAVRGELITFDYDGRRETFALETY